MASLHSCLDTKFAALLMWKPLRSAEYDAESPYQICIHSALFKEKNELFWKILVASDFW